MDKLPEITAKTNSDQPSNKSANTAHAATMAARLFGYFPPPDVGDPNILLAGAVAIFACYPPEVVEAVVDPVRGLPSSSKWAPNLAEIRQALDAEVARTAPSQYAREWDAAAAKQLAERQLLTDQRPRPTYEELQRRCHEVGLMIGPKGSRLPPVDPVQIQKQYGISKEQWDAIPNAKRG